MKNKKFEDLKKRGQKLEEQINKISKLMNNEEVITESSLSRAWGWSEEYDISIITAFRKVNKDCLHTIDGEEEGHKYTKRENKERNTDLYSVLLSKGYYVTKVKGSYIEGFETPEEVEVGEDSFFVVNRNNDSEFFETLIKLGKYFCQDSVLLKPKGEDAFLYGTNNSPFPGLDNKHLLGKFKGGEPSEFMTRVGKNLRPFRFAEEFNVNSRHIISQRTKKIIGKL